MFLVQPDAAKRQRACRYCIGKGFALFIAVMKFLGVLSYEIRHAERLQNHQGTLVIANHPSLIDVVFLVSFFPQTECIVKSAVTRNFFMRSAVSAANYISNEDPRELLAVCTERLKQGANLVWFPEATRSVVGQPLDFKPGAAAVAIRSRARILPILIRVSPTTLTKGDPWYHIPRRRPHWELDVLPTISLEDSVTKPPDLRQETRALNLRLASLFEQALENSAEKMQPALSGNIQPG